MSRVKLLLVSVMAVFAVAAVAASAASAAPPEWKFEGGVNKGTLSVLALLSGAAILKSEISKVKFELSCTAAHATGSILEGTRDTAPNGIPFAGCTVIKPTGCKVKEPIQTAPLSSALLTKEEGAKRFDTWTPQVGTEFATFTYEGNPECSIEGKDSITGKLQCAGEAIEAVDFSCLFNETSGSELKFGKESATFIAHFLFLLKGANAGKKWGTS
jgi:hypothetical protein